MSTQRPGFSDNLAALRHAQKPSRGTAAYSRYVNRPTGRLVAAWAHSIRMTPNQATAISATLSGSGIGLLAFVQPTWAVGVLIAVLLAAGYVWDSVDGQLARLRGGGSKAGEWLDHTIDCFKTVSLHLAVLISWYRFAPITNDLWLLVPIAFTIIASATYFGLILLPTLRVEKPEQQPQPAEPWWRAFVILPIDYGLHCWIFVLLGWWTGFAVVYTAVAALCGLALVAALRKWWRELRELDEAIA